MITSYFHCGKCLEEMKDGVAPDQSPSEYSRLEAGWSKHGIQVRCIRHDLNVVHLDFEGRKVAAISDTTQEEARVMAKAGKVRDE